MNWILFNLGTCSLDETLDAIKHYHVGCILVDVRDIADGKNKPEEYKRLVRHLKSILMLRKMGYRVIIRCHAGISRSNGIAIGVLMIQNNMIYEDARKIIEKFVPQANPQPDFMDDIKKAVKELKDYVPLEERILKIEKWIKKER